MDTTITNVNYLITQVFQMDIPLAPSVNEFIQSVSLPGVTLGEAQIETPFIRQPEPGDKLIFSPISISFLVDEYMNNWKEVFNWLTALGFPTSLQQYGVLPHKVNRVDSSQVTCDITILVHDNYSKPILKFTMFGAFPINLGDIPISTVETAAQTAMCTADFMYQHYEVQSLI